MNSLSENTQQKSPGILHDIMQETKIYLTRMPTSNYAKTFYNKVDTYKVVMKFKGRQLTHYINLPQNFNGSLSPGYVMGLLCYEANSYHYIRNFEQFCLNYGFNTEKEAEYAYKSASKIYQNLIRLYDINATDMLLSHFR